MARLRALDDYKHLLETTAPDAPDLLLRGALAIARHRYPDLDEQKVYGALDDMARRVAGLLPEARYPLKVVQAINQIMYREWGFRGNEEDYYSADNSCINRVIERRAGIPLTLSLVYMEVARRVGLPMRGLNLPLHFMLQPAVEGVEVLVDAFRGGEVVSLGEAEERIGALAGGRVRLDPAVVQDTAPLPPRKFLLRMLTNLRAVYFSTQQLELALVVVQFMRATHTAEEAAGPPGWGAARDEGLCYFALRRYPEALEALAGYLKAVPARGGGEEAAQDRAMVAQVMEEARRRMSAADG